jgi:hypothetical protein
MSFEAQALYFHLGVEYADDDGFINSPIKATRASGAALQSLEELIDKRFLLRFKNGVVVIKHWRMQNKIQKDRYKPTVYQEEFNQLIIQDDGRYSFKPNAEQSASGLDTDCIQDVSKVDTDCIRKLSKDKLSKVKDISSTYIDTYIGGDSSTYHRQLNSARAEKKAYGKYGNVWLEERELSNLKTMYPDWNKLIDNLSSYLKKTGKTYDDHYVTICEWADEDAAKAKEKPKGKKSEPTDGGSFDTEEFFAAAKARA